MMNSNSKVGQLDFTDLVNLGKNAALVGAGAALTYISGNVAHVDLGLYGPILVAVVTPIIDAAIKLLKNNQKDKDAK